ncbi:MAG: antibiotic biosynthesis monooxygenase [bacterium]
MIVVLFWSRLTNEAGEDYSAMASEMVERAKHTVGFVDFKSFAAQDGERLSIIHWQDEATMTVWANDERHRVARQLGRDKWYQYFRLEVAHVTRGWDFHRA